MADGDDVDTKSSSPSPAGDRCYRMGQLEGINILLLYVEDEDRVRLSFDCERTRDWASMHSRNHRDDLVRFACKNNDAKKFVNWTQRTGLGQSTSKRADEDTLLRLRKSLKIQTSERSRQRRNPRRETGYEMLGAHACVPGVFAAVISAKEIIV